MLLPAAGDELLMAKWWGGEMLELEKEERSRERGQE